MATLPAPATIIGGPISPYVRKVLAVCEIKGVAYRLDPIVPFFGDEKFSELSPLRRVPVFVDDKLSNWYVRRNRRRFWKSEKGGDKLAAYQKLFAPLTALVTSLFGLDRLYFFSETFANGNRFNNGYNRYGGLGWAPAPAGSFQMQVAPLDPDLAIPGGG